MKTRMRSFCCLRFIGRSVFFTGRIRYPFLLMSSTSGAGFALEGACSVMSSSSSATISVSSAGKVKCYTKSLTESRSVCLLKHLWIYSVQRRITPGSFSHAGYVSVNRSRPAVSGNSWLKGSYGKILYLHEKLLDLHCQGDSSISVQVSRENYYLHAELSFHVGGEILNILLTMFFGHSSCEKLADEVNGETKLTHSCCTSAGGFSSFQDLAANLYSSMMSGGSSSHILFKPSWYLLKYSQVPGRAPESSCTASWIWAFISFPTTCLYVYLLLVHACLLSRWRPLLYIQFFTFYSNGRGSNEYHKHDLES